MKKIFSILLAFSFLLALVGCDGESGGNAVADSNGDGKLSCTLEIRCDTLLPNLDKLSEGKAALVPESGALLEKIEVEFSAGQSVFDVFRSVLREEKIHFEYVDSRVYNSVYIEGIGNLYEFDCGPQSGWVYSVNGVQPGLGCSAYFLSDGDEICFSYTCDLGADLGMELNNEN